MTIKAAIQAILTKLATLSVTNDGQSTLYVRMWNGQIDQEQAGELGYDFPKPAAFLEILNDQIYEDIGQGYQQSDLVFRVHLVHEYYNQDGTFEQDLPVFDLRDSVVQLLSYYKPAAWCGALFRKGETQDYNHKNIYHYIIDFTCNFIDSAAIKTYVANVPPVSLEANVTTSKGGGQVAQSLNFQINK